MGLSATVMCTCWADGSIPAPPFAAHLTIDDEAYLSLDLPYEENAALFGALDAWMADACPHPRMEAAHEHIGNWPGYRSFQQALGDAGWEHFPVLRRELPDANGGTTSADDARRMMEELDRFASRGAPGLRFVLLDAEDGEVIAEAVGAYGGVFSMNGQDGLEAGIDARGFFVRPLGGGPERFRAAEFTQDLLNPEPPDRYEARRVRFTDLATGRTLECRSPVAGRSIPWPDGRALNDRGELRLAYPRRITATRRDVHPADFSAIVSALLRVCRASAETGNPIRWT